MSTGTGPNLMTDGPLREELQHLRESWLLLLILGVGLVVVGIAALISSFIATLATALFFGTLLLVGGVMQLVNAVTCRNWRGFFIYLLAGVLFAVVGLIMMNHPLVAAAGLTLMLAAAFIVGGIVRIIGAAVDHFYGWPWVMISGFITLFLGIFIWRHFPETAFWVIGLFIGIELIFSGMSWIVLAIGIRRTFPAKT
jgi:uncharacterized membrane protein HdeD (DUF308 family)